MAVSPEEIAREHVAWALKQGQSPAQIVLSVGGTLRRGDLNARDAEHAVSDAWVRMWIRGRQIKSKAKQRRAA
jgi:hypothetical protein